MKRFIISAILLITTALAFGAERIRMDIPADMLDTDCLFGSRLVRVSKPSSKAYSDGQMKEQPVLVRLRNEGNEYITMTQIGHTDSEGTSWKTRNDTFATERFRIISINDGSYTVDMTEYLSSYPLLVSVITPKDLKGNAANYEIRNSSKGDGYITMLLDYAYPDALHARVNYFFMKLRPNALSFNGVDGEKVGYESLEYRNSKGERSYKPYRWDLSAGRQIVFYVDRAFPKEWFPYIKEGLEDWNKAFEAIGIHSPIVVLQETDAVDRNSPLVNMVRFVDSSEANAKGQCFVDPRSGEVLQADILWWKGALKLLCDWRYLQTGAADPAARQLEYPLEMIGPMIRHAMSHEMGHVLGLSHNMGGSWAYTPEQLKSPEFTAVYGTTASIMDYARYNHIATPADVEAGVNMLPPRLGPYDMYAIAAGYSKEDATPGEYCFFSPFISAAISPDPSSQAETLGNDVIKSSDKGLYNCLQLLLSDGLTKERVDLIQKQYYKYIHLALSNLGGTVHGVPVNLVKQIQTLNFIFRGLEDCPQAIYDKDTEKQILNELNGKFIPKRITDNNGPKALKAYQKVLKYRKKKFTNK